MTINSLFVALVLAVVGFAVGPETQRFDYVVRADFFAGFGGDEARLQKAMDACETVLAENPKHAEALVWHGAGLLFRAGQRFQAGESQRGMQLFQSGLEQMTEAVALEPDNVAVLIPRGAVLLTATRSMDPVVARPLLEQAVADYEKVLRLQEGYFDTLGDHPRGELLFGLAEGSARLGRPDKTRAYFDRLIKDAPTSGQTARAEGWLNTGALPRIVGPGCMGCHTQ